MKLSDIERNNYNLVSDLENLFNVYLDKKNNYVFNLNTGLYVTIPQSRMKIFTPSHAMHWSIISHKLYGTTHLAWLLMKVNHISTDRIFKPVIAGMPIVYPSEMDVNEILRSINDEA